MTKKSQAESRSLEHSQKPKSGQESIDNQSETPSPLSSLSAAVSADSVESQAEMLGRLNMPRQRAMIQQIGHVQGNRYVQRLVETYKQVSSLPNQPVIQREREPRLPHYSYAPPEITEADVTNDRASLASTRLEDLFFLYGAGFRLHRMMPPSRHVYSREWILGPEGTALLCGHIMARLNTVLDQPEMQERLITQVNQIRGAEARKTELVEMIRHSFARVESMGLERAQSSSPFLAETGRQGRTWSPRGMSRDQTRDMSDRIHAAMDVPAPTGTGVYTPIDGQVIFSGRASGYGNMVCILHENPPRTEVAGEGPLSTNYAHLDERLVEAGARVRAGEAIGLIGTERAGPRGPQDVGGVTEPIGAHLHFSVQRVPSGGVGWTDTGRFSSRYEEGGAIRIHTGQWLNQLGVAVTGSDDRALRRYEERRQREAEGEEEVQRTLSSESSGSATLRHSGVQPTEGSPSSRLLSVTATESLHTQVQRYIPASELTAFETPVQTEFMRRVYTIQRQRSSGRRSYVGNVPPPELAVVEDGFSLRTQAAEPCRNLLAAARTALAADQHTGDELALQAHSIGLGSAYRSATSQLTGWRDNFPDYYEQTQETRASKPGGEHGEAAARYLAGYISGRLAAPGYSMHNNGLAIDCRTRQGEHDLRARGAQRALWEASWFYRWLAAHASEYQFALNPGINEPWHWEYQGETEEESAGE